MAAGRVDYSGVFWIPLIEDSSCFLPLVPVNWDFSSVFSTLPLEGAFGWNSVGLAIVESSVVLSVA